MLQKINIELVGIYKKKKKAQTPQRDNLQIIPI